jgi:hypothetical protein
MDAAPKLSVRNHVFNGHLEPPTRRKCRFGRVRRKAYAFDVAATFLTVQKSTSDR